MLNKLWGIYDSHWVCLRRQPAKSEKSEQRHWIRQKEAVTLCITMLGIMSMWTGLMNVAKKAGIIDALTKALRPVLAFFFSGRAKEHKANEYMVANYD